MYTYIYIYIYIYTLNSLPNTGGETFSGPLVDADACQGSEKGLMSTADIYSTVYIILEHRIHYFKQTL